MTNKECEKSRSPTYHDSRLVSTSYSLSPEIDQEHPSPGIDFDPGLFGYYSGFYNQVHIDEKWIFVAEEKLKIYLSHGKEALTRRTRDKDHIEKVMFLSAVTCPCFDDNKVCVLHLAICSPSGSPKDFHLSTSRDNGNKIRHQRHYGCIARYPTLHL
jgi:hypothetical protein